MPDKTPLASARKRHIMIVIAGFAAIIALITFLGLGLQKSGTQIPSTQIGKQAKPFKLRWIQGKEHLRDTGDYLRLEDLKGKSIVLNFWASWCVSCRQEARDLEHLWQEIKEDGDTIVVGVAIQDSVEEAKAFAQQYGKTYILALDEDGAASIDYGVTGVPESFFINRQGEIVHKEAAPLDFPTLLKYANQIVTKKIGGG